MEMRRGRVKPVIETKKDLKVHYRTFRHNLGLLSKLDQNALAPALLAKDPLFAEESVINASSSPHRRGRGRGGGGKKGRGGSGRGGGRGRRGGAGAGDLSSSPSIVLDSNVTVATAAAAVLNRPEAGRAALPLASESVPPASLGRRLLLLLR